MTAPADVLLDQARVQLARQEAKLDAMRTLAAAAVTAGGVIAGFVAPSVAALHRWLVLPPLVALAACSVAAGLAITPRRGLMFSEGLHTYVDWIGRYGDRPGADASFTLGLAQNLDRSRTANAGKVQRVTELTEWAARLFVAEVLLWVVALVVG